MGMQPRFKQVPPDIPAFNQSGGQSKLCGADGCFVAARTGADDDKLIFFHDIIPLQKVVNGPADRLFAVLPGQTGNLF